MNAEDYGMVRLDLTHLAPDFLPPDHYRAYFDGNPVPAYDELNGRIFGRASEFWDGSTHTLTTHNSLSGVDVANPGDRIFFVRRCRGESCQEGLNWAEANGYRAATLAETRAFVEAHASVWRLLLLVIVGSFMEYCGGTYVPVLCGPEDYLGSGWFGDRWGDGCALLLVRK